MDYYEILGVDKSATQEEIKKAYRNKAKEYHPDAGGDAEKFKQINEANSILSDEAKRKDYDRYGSVGNHDNFDFSDIMSRFRFRQPKKTYKITPDVIVNISITLEEIYSGVNKEITFNHAVFCEECNGDGGTDVVVCDECSGEGVKINKIDLGGRVFLTKETCHKCNGNGKSFKTPCNGCNSSGFKLKQDRTIINIPIGVTHGDMLVLGGGGNEYDKNKFGNLKIIVHQLQHKVFVRDGNNLLYKLELSYPEMVLGVSKELKTLNNTTLKFSIPELSKDKSNIRLKGKGINGGDIIVQLNIVMPDKITDEERVLLTKLLK